MLFGSQIFLQKLIFFLVSHFITLLKCENVNDLFRYRFGAFSVFSSFQFTYKTSS